MMRPYQSSVVSLASARGRDVDNGLSRYTGGSLKMKCRVSRCVEDCTAPVEPFDTGSLHVQWCRKSEQIQQRAETRIPVRRSGATQLGTHLGTLIRLSAKKNVSRPGTAWDNKLPTVGTAELCRYGRSPRLGPYLVGNWGTLQGFSRSDVSYGY